MTTIPAPPATSAIPAPFAVPASSVVPAPSASPAPSAIPASPASPVAFAPSAIPVSVPDGGRRVAPDVPGPVRRGTGPGTRRAELGAFLRSRRERITPEAVGLPPGLRRRTPGLRREEVALLAGVGVTWYTWLEQGRPINASVQVLDAVSRTLGLDRAEREHLYRLADMPAVPDPDTCGSLGPEVQVILDQLDPLPAGVYNGRYDLLAWNEAYAALFPNVATQPVETRNALWQLFVTRECCSVVVDRVGELPQMVATLRAGFGRHLGEPAWTGFVRDLSAASPEFARMWATHDVARPGNRLKLFHHSAVGQIRTTSTSMALSSPPEARVVVYLPVDDESRERVAWIRAHPEVPAVTHTHPVTTEG